MGNDLAVIQHNAPAQVTVLSTDQLQYIAGTEFVPKGLRNNLPAILACVATGRAIGIDDMSAIRSIHIIDGKATFSAELMVMLVRRRGHSITGEVSDGSAKVTGRRADNGDEMSVTWTLEMAKRAKLANKSNWLAYPEAMLWARAVSQLSRMLFADCFAGGTYTAEELSDVEEAAPSEQAEDWDGWFPPPADADGEASHPESPSPTTPASGSVATSDNAGGSPAAVISEAQRRRLHAIRSSAGMSEAALKALMGEMLGVTSTKDIPRDRYEELVAAIEAATPEPSGEGSFAARAAEAQAVIIPSRGVDSRV